MNQKPDAHIALVLAAGGSRRLGVPKQLLKRGGETLVRRAVRLASATQPQRLLLVIGAHGDEMREAVADLRVEILVNDDWREGLASSLRAAVGTLDGSASALILGCDQPALEQRHLQRLLAGAAASVSGCAATLHGAAPGIPAVVSAAVLREAHELHGDSGLRGSLQRLASGSLYLLEAAELEFDLDTPADVKKAVADGLLD
ncbi:MAG TPA: nucleotidyltransferase family protein [Pseudoxanthomonas sp.]|nr:nucleotidyltransferase family protein [Pseudoxanthomonas sp.]